MNRELCFSCNSVICWNLFNVTSMEVTEGMNSIDKALARVESDLLPSIDKKNLQGVHIPLSTISSNLGIDYDENSHRRIDDLMYQIALADHIRAMQTMYRDSNDDQCLAIELRQNDLDTKLPIKHILTKITEGRCRAIPLVKLLYGKESVEMIRTLLDLSAAYALQGMWEQVDEKVGTTLEKLAVVSRSRYADKYAIRRTRAVEAATNLTKLFGALKEHVTKNMGQVKKSFIPKVVSALSPTPIQPDTDGMGDVAKLAASLHSFFASPSTGKPMQAMTVGPVSGPLHQYVNSTAKRAMEEKKRTWGDFIDYLRRHCSVVKAWIDEVQNFVMPQSKAALLLAFRVCDRSAKGVAHPVHLSHVLRYFPSTVRLLAGTSLAKEFSKLRTEITLGVGDSLQATPQELIDQYGQNMPHSVYYELPITWEEFLSRYLIDIAPMNQLELMRVQLLTLKGVASIYSNQVIAAEHTLTKALNGLERLGLDMEIVACELYNSIAQMMIMKHKQWNDRRKARVKEESILWLETSEGKKSLKAELKILKQQVNYTPDPILQAELDVRAKANAIKKRTVFLMNTSSTEDKGEIGKSLEAAHRYLVRSYEIIEETHGSLHPAVGTACLAVASVQNILEDYDDTRDWLMRALRYMEKSFPVPHRAISFTQAQLSLVLLKQKHEEEAVKVLSKAVAFHMEQAMQFVGLHNSQPDNYIVDSSHYHSAHKRLTTQEEKKKPVTDFDNGIMAGDENHQLHSTFGISVPPPILKGTPLNDEVETAVELANRLMKLYSKQNDKWQASKQAEETAKLMELAYGWDSIEAADAYRQVNVAL